MTIGSVGLGFIPFLLWQDREDEVPDAIVWGILFIVLGFVIVKFLTKPSKW